MLDFQDTGLDRVWVLGIGVILWNQDGGVVDTVLLHFYNKGGALSLCWLFGWVTSNRMPWCLLLARVGFLMLLGKRNDGTGVVCTLLSYFGSLYRFFYALISMSVPTIPRDQKGNRSFILVLQGGALPHVSKSTLSSKK